MVQLDDVLLHWCIDIARDGPSHDAHQIGVFRIKSNITFKMVSNNQREYLNLNFCSSQNFMKKTRKLGSYYSWNVGLGLI